jgi:hypothetical protein
VDHRHGQFPATTRIGDRAVPGVQYAVDLGVFPSLGMTDVRKAEIVLFGPEEGYRPCLIFIVPSGIADSATP